MQWSDQAIILGIRRHGESSAIVEVMSATHGRRLGMVGNWRKTFRRARKTYPASPYFAWVSDHDVWHPRWLGKLVHTLDADPGVVMAYPLRIGIDDTGELVRAPWEFDTRGLQS